MEFKREKNRIYAENAQGRLLAEVVFPGHGGSRVLIERTFVAEELRGQNVASDLMQAAYAEIKAQGKKADLKCKYAVKWFEKHPEAGDILD